MKCTRNGVQCAHRRSVATSYKGTPTVCNYLIDTGKTRGCPAGAKCVHWAAEKAKRSTKV